jgi:hypothetical protein
VRLSRGKSESGTRLDRVVCIYLSRFPSCRCRCRCRYRCNRSSMCISIIFIARQPPVDAHGHRGYGRKKWRDVRWICPLLALVFYGNYRNRLVISSELNSIVHIVRNKEKRAGISINHQHELPIISKKNRSVPTPISGRRCNLA